MNSSNQEKIANHYSPTPLTFYFTETGRVDGIYNHKAFYYDTMVVMDYQSSTIQTPQPPQFYRISDPDYQTFFNYIKNNADEFFNLKSDLTTSDTDKVRIIVTISGHKNKETFSN